MAHHQRIARRIAVASLVAGAAAGAHQFGYHTSVDLVVRPDGMTALVTMDVPRGREALLQRAQADRNGDKELDADERQTLKANLTRFATRMLEVRRDGAVVTPRVAEAKMFLSQSTAVDDSPLSIAAMLEYAAGEGPVDVRDEAPDSLPVPVRISFEPPSSPAIEGMVRKTVPLQAKPPW